MNQTKDITEDKTNKEESTQTNNEDTEEESTQTSSRYVGKNCSMAKCNCTDEEKGQMVGECMENAFFLDIESFYKKEGIDLVNSYNKPCIVFIEITMVEGYKMALNPHIPGISADIIDKEIYERRGEPNFSFTRIYRTDDVRGCIRGLVDDRFVKRFGVTNVHVFPSFKKSRRVFGIVNKVANRIDMEQWEKYILNNGDSEQT